MNKHLLLDCIKRECLEAVMKSCKNSTNIHGIELYKVKDGLNFLKRPGKNLSYGVPIKKLRKHKMSSISILITRNEDSKSDDHIRIVPVIGNPKQFQVTYADHGDSDCNCSTSKYSFTASAQGVREYLETTLNLLLKDDEPFQRLQFNLPAYPRIMVDLKKIQDEEFMETIWHAIASVCDDWPLRLPNKVEETSSHESFNTY